MMPATRCLRTSIIAAFLLIAATAHAQRSNTLANYRIAGRVVNAVSGEPLPRSTVKLLAESDSHTLVTTLTDNEGHFSIEGLAAEKYQLTAAKRGYLTSFYDSHEEFSSAIVTGSRTGSEAYLKVDDITFKLKPGGVIRGYVNDDAGEPVEGASVRLYRRTHDHGVGIRTISGTTELTDDTGAYEFGNLEPGNYLIAVVASPWFAQANSATTDEDSNNGLDVAYPVTYYDSTTDEGSATVIELENGHRVEANINLYSVPALHLTLPAKNGAETDDGAPQLTQMIFGAPADKQMLVNSTDEFVDGAINPARHASPTNSFSGIAPGKYTLEEGNPPRTLTIDLRNSQQLDTNAELGLASVSGTLHSATGKSLPDSIRLVLERTDSDAPTQNTAVDSVKNKFSFDELEPGRYALWAADGAKSLATVAIRNKELVTAGGEFSVADHSIKLDVTLAEDLVHVRGLATKYGKGFPGAMIVLLPDNPAALHSLVRRDQSDSDGTFNLRDVAPGRYKLLAIEDGWNLDWAKPGELERYLSSGASVNIQSANSGDVQLDKPLQVIPK